MKFAGTFSSWNKDIWDIKTGDYPRLNWENITLEEKEHPTLGKNGKGYYNITDCYDLQSMKYNLSLNYELINNINCSMSSGWNNEKGFIPIGNSTNRFTGSFNGNNYNISNLTINRSSENFVGLFGYAQNGEIKDVGLINVNITGNINVGGLVGYSSSTITNSYSTGSVNGNGNNVGGLVGSSSYSTITNSYSTGNVSGTGYNVGGLVGFSFSSITNSYSTGSVNGNIQVGGLVGRSDSQIYNSYSTGSVNGDHYVGGLVGISHSTI